MFPMKVNVNMDLVIRGCHSSRNHDYFGSAPNKPDGCQSWILAWHYLSVDPLKVDIYIYIKYTYIVYIYISSIYLYIIYLYIYVIYVYMWSIYIYMWYMVNLSKESKAKNLKSELRFWYKPSNGGKQKIPRHPIGLLPSWDSLKSSKNI